jgi:hypothetical protein
MGRKDASADITVTSPNFAYNKIDIAYDANKAGRLISEKLTGSGDAWENQFGYDAGENVSSIVRPSINKTLTYGAGNREATVSGVAGQP